MENKREIIDSGFNLDNTYENLPSTFYSKVEVAPVSLPKLFILNEELAKELGLNIEYLKSKEGIDILSGSDKLKSGSYIAQAYAGHQFGHFNMLGDGRALLIGEQITPSNQRYDIQLKGSGKTPYSRRGDGKAALSPMMREYIISEAMNALGINTTRSLAVLKTGEKVYREDIKQGAILVRIASSHIRFATFQYAAAYGGKEGVKALADYTIKRHFDYIKDDENKYINLLKEIVNIHAKLVANWESIGFIHGVMNTDNMSIIGETIDYGPCAFMDIYDENTVFSSIDTYGRYSYKNQPMITEWNLCRLAETLIPIINEDREVSIKLAQETVTEFSYIYHNYYMKNMRYKLGIYNEELQDKALIEDLLKLMKKYKLDYTNTFVSLTLGEEISNDMCNDDEFKYWYKIWIDRLSRQNKSKEEINELMRKSNPSIIPRNHKVEKVLSDCEVGKFESLKQFLDLTSNPYAYTEEQNKYMKLPKYINKNYRTYCGT